MFIIEKTEIAKAIENARELHPVVRMVRFGSTPSQAAKVTHTSSGAGERRE